MFTIIFTDINTVLKLGNLELHFIILFNCFILQESFCQGVYGSKGQSQQFMFYKRLHFHKTKDPTSDFRWGGGGGFGGVAVGLFLNFSAVGADKRKLTSSNCS